MNQQIGISLAGGAARGIAHIGVFQALEEHGISPTHVSGASAGSIVGALYAAGKTPGEMLRIFKSTSLLKLFKPSVSTLGLTDLGTIKEILAEHIDIDSFSALQRQLFISVTNMSKGRFEIVSTGPLFETVCASSSIPILFKARQKGQDLYVDGGLLNNLPVEPLRERCSLVIGVNVTPIEGRTDLDDLMTIGYRTLDLVMWANVKPRLEQCDVVIEPATAEVALFDVDKADEIYQLGYDAAKAQISTIKKLLASKGVQSIPSSAISIPPAVQDATRTRNIGARIGHAVLEGGKRLLGTNRTAEATTERDKALLPPGAMFYVGRRRVGPTILGLIRYNEKELEEHGSIELEDFNKPLGTEKIAWFNVDGVHNGEDIAQVGKSFNLHPLTLEDILNTAERPKFEAIDDYIYLRLKMLNNLEREEKIDVEQVSLVLRAGQVISFQEKSEDVLEPLRERLRASKGRVRKANADYLFYAIMDMVVSQYFGAVEEIADRTAIVESRLLDQRTDSNLLNEIHELKKATTFLKRNIYPLRSALSELLRDESELVDSKTKEYLNDLEDELLQVIENVDDTYTTLSDLSDQFIALSGHKANDIMKVLTIMATIFIPLTFIVGVYGMNFDHMPELHMKYGYHAVWGLMVAIFLGLIMYFRKKKWL
ncbi:MAG: magnesium/cobalt transporter CorA [Bacteroidia bacterium]